MDLSASVGSVLVFLIFCGKKPVLIIVIIFLLRHLPLIMLSTIVALTVHAGILLLYIFSIKVDTLSVTSRTK